MMMYDSIPLSHLYNVEQSKTVLEPRPFGRSIAPNVILVKLFELGNWVPVRLTLNWDCASEGPRERDRDHGSIGVEDSVQVEGADSVRNSIECALRAAIRMEELGGAEILIKLRVLEEDGGLLAAALLAASTALVHAGIPLFDIPVAAQVALNTEGIAVPLPSRVPLPIDCPSVIVAVLPSLNQVVCCEQKGVIPLSRLQDAIRAAAATASLRFPVVRKALLQALDDP